MNFLLKIFGDAHERYLKKLDKVVAEIDAFEPEMEKLPDAGLAERMRRLRDRRQSGQKNLDELLPECFALTREAAKRTLGQRHYAVQLKGAVVLHEGKIAEMKTGEGKTLTATLAIALNALSGKGVHVVTVNDYLAQRDAVWMGQVYHRLGLTVGCIQQQERSFVYDPTATGQGGPHRQEADKALDEERDTLGSFKVVHEFLRPCTRKEAYQADITYGTNNEFGFDYLRDNLVTTLEERVQRGFNYAIVDEVDSILIDEARTPLIISQPDSEATKRYQEFARIVAKLEADKHYTVEEKHRAVHLTEAGIDRVEALLGVKNLYGQSDIRILHHLEQALKAKALFHRDRNYIVKSGEVIIVDEFTGRLMHGRRYSEGLHQAIEAKEGVTVKQESRTLATVTFQNYFRMYRKLAGMTGTAATNAEEFARVYGLEVVVVPTHKPMIRQDLVDQIYRTEKGKFLAVARAIKEKHERGQPVLVGTVSIEKNEILSKLLRKIGIAHEILNAKNHEREAEIIAQAGRRGAVTVATNMAGRGVDIVLGGNPPDKEEAEAVKKRGGLFVIGTERHEARRIDNQLRGRAGRQGDPGASQFYVSLEDELMRVFAGDRVKNLMERFNFPEDQAISNRLVARAIERAQERIEGYNFDLRKYVLEYDDVMNRHRATIYKLRGELLTPAAAGADPEKRRQYLEKIKNRLRQEAEQELADLADSYLAGDETRHWDRPAFINDLKSTFSLSNRETASLLEKDSDRPAALRAQIIEALNDEIKKRLAERQQALGEFNFLEAVRLLWLRTTDFLWMEHIEAMQHLRDAVRLRAFGQRDPLVEYKRESHRLFQELLADIRARVLQAVFHVEEAPPAAQMAAAGALRFGREVLPAAAVGAGAAANESATFSRRMTPADQPSSPAVFTETAKGERVGRNDPCPCGAVNPATGRVYKYKKCGLINAPHHKP